MGVVIGIDLGTAHTCTAVYRHDQFEVIPHEGQPLMPSYVAFTETGRLIGQAAKNQASANPKNTIFNALKFVGASYQDDKVQEMIKMLPFSVVHDGALFADKRKPFFEVMYKGDRTTFAPVEILAMIIKKAKKDAERHLGDSVWNAIITIPCDFNLSQHHAIIDAALIAGINPLRLVRTPTVALADLMVSQKTTGERNVLVCDIGAAYYGVVVASLEEGVQVILAARSLGHCVGDEYNTRLINYMMHLFKARKSKQHINRQGNVDVDDIANDSRAVRRLRIACEKAKHQLSSAEEATVEIEQLHNGKDFKASITRKVFEGLIEDCLHSLLESIQEALRDAKLEKNEVAEIVLIGGSSRIPKVQKEISGFFAGNVPIRCLNPEESSARGAAVHAAILSGDTTCKASYELILMELLHKSIIVETPDGRMTELMKRGTIIPNNRRGTFSTDQDNQQSFLVTYYEGDRTRINDLLELGHAQVAVSPAARGVQQLEICLSIDANHMITATLIDKATGKESSVGLHGYNAGSFDRISQDKTERLILAEEQMEADDDLEEARIETRNAIEELVFSFKGWIDSWPRERRCSGTITLEVMADTFLEWLDENQFATTQQYKARIEQLEAQRLEAEREQVANERSYSQQNSTIVEDKGEVRYDQSPPNQMNQVEASLDETRGHINQAIEPPSISSSPIQKSTAKQVLESTGPARSETPRTAARGIASLFDSKPTEGSSLTFTDTEFIHISTYLKNTGQPDWSKIPRLYTVLRLIGQLDMLDVFIQQGITDIWFPFAQTTLPRGLSPSARANFLKRQEAVLSKSLMFEKSPNKKHARFLQGEPLPYEVIGKLGVGAHGQVDKVMSIVSHQEYARKLFRRQRGMSKDAINSFLIELQVLKRVQHYHCIELVQSYTDPKYFALIMSPVGECNLLEYYSLALNNPDKSSLLRSFFGCLAKALEYIHSIKIRHRDIKPHNILVRGDRVFLTDFGIALDWEELSRSTTTADSGKTWLYAAPEVARYEKRNTAADVWSLGCVFMEMATILKGQPISAMRKFFEQETGNYRFYTNISRLNVWADHCRQQLGSPQEDVIFDWILLMLEEDPDKRPTAATLHHDINVECTRQGVPFSGTCCLENVESSEADEYDDEDEAWDVHGEELTIIPGKVPSYH